VKVLLHVLEEKELTASFRAGFFYQQPVTSHMLIVGFVFESFLIVRAIYFLALKKNTLQKLPNNTIDGISFLH
jgi:hypothetical protein